MTINSFMIDPDCSVSAFSLSSYVLSSSFHMIFQFSVPIFFIIVLSDSAPCSQDQGKNAGQYADVLRKLY